MIEVVEINLTKLLKVGLNINEYLTMVKLHLMVKEQIIPFNTSQSIVQSLVDKGYLEHSNDLITITSKGYKLLNNSSNGITDKEFDEIYFLYPEKTPGGRILRSKNKMVMGKLTRDFDVLLKKYMSVIKNIDDHNSVVQATKNMIYDYKRRGSSEFLPKLETYINQRGWEKYLDMSPFEIAGNENIERL